MQHDSLIIKKKITTLKHATVLSGLEHTTNDQQTDTYCLTKELEYWRTSDDQNQFHFEWNNDILGTLTNDADKSGQHVPSDQ
jgi:hypothetical protein